MTGTPSRPARPGSLLTDDDLWLFNEGSHARLWERLGAHLGGPRDARGCHFAVWAPEAERVAVVGDFNGWNEHEDQLHRLGESGIWETFVPRAREGHAYKLHLTSRHGGSPVLKADPFAFCSEPPPRNASVVHDLRYAWGDGEWLRARENANALSAPISIYELHVGSWRTVQEESDRPLTYTELAECLPPYLTSLGFTHVELMPVMEHPFPGSWGYQVTGYFAAARRFGSPQELMALVDALHRAGIGVILDWVPSHFAIDPHGLATFDGSPVYEHRDEKQRIHPDWKSAIFDYGRNEVRAFLISSACFWLEVFHADGLRVDGVASMLHRDYSRSEGEWVANVDGGRENLEALAFLRQLTGTLAVQHPDALTMAEDSSAWPMVTRPIEEGGLGFGLKWDMGWMHDTLRYLQRDPVHRSYHQHELTFRSLYAFRESYVLPLSHDEVVHGKGALAGKMPGDSWQKLANLRALYGLMYAQPGKKLLFMGNELAPWGEWDSRKSLDWHLLQWERHDGVRRLIADLNALYRGERALHELDCDPAGFRWLECDDAAASIYSMLRAGSGAARPVVAVFNLTPVVRADHRIGVPCGGPWRVALDTDAACYGGSGALAAGSFTAQRVGHKGCDDSLVLTLPPLAALFLVPATR